MWDSSLYAVNIIGLIKDCFGPIAGQNLARQGKLNRMLEERRMESRRSHGAATGDRCAENLLVGHDLMVMHKLIEMC